MRNAGIHANSLLGVRRMYNAVGIDVSKGKSTVTVLQPGSIVIRKPFDVPHTSRTFMHWQAILVHYRAQPGSLWNVRADTMNPWSGFWSKPDCLFPLLIPTSSKTLATTLSARLNPTRRMPARSHAIRLTIGQNCANIQVWKIHVPSLKP